MDTPQGGPFELVSHRLGALPLINHFLDRIGLARLLARYLPAADARLQLAPATAIRLVVRNLLVGREPLYGLGEWAARYAPALLGLCPAATPARLNDDRVGRALERLFDADRASLLTELVARGDRRVRHRHHRAAQRLHLGHACPGSTETRPATPRGGKPTPAVTFGHSKDHRPDLKQLVWILTVAADGAVPIAYRLADGNTTDDPTHIPTWDGLVALLGRRRLPLRRGLQAVLARGDGPHRRRRRPVRHRAAPHPRARTRWFRDWIQTHQPQWTEAHPAARRPARRPRPGVLDLPRAAALRRGLPDHLGALHRQGRPRRRRPRGPRSRPASPPSTPWPPAWPARSAGSRPGSPSSQAATTALDRRRRRPLGQRHRHRDRRRRASGRNAAAGPAPNTRYRRHTAHPPHDQPGTTRDDAIAYDAATDGCFPLITNDTDADRRRGARRLPLPAQPGTPPPPAQVRPGRRPGAAAQTRPASRPCSAASSSPCSLGALIERQIRTAMTAAAHRRHPALPRAPRLHRPLHRTHPGDLRRPRPATSSTTTANSSRPSNPSSTPLQQQVLDLLDVPTTAYTRHRH